MVRSVIVVGMVINTLISVAYIAMLVWLWEGSFFDWLLNVFFFSIPFGIITLFLRWGLVVIGGLIIENKVEKMTCSRISVTSKSFL